MSRPAAAHGGGAHPRGWWARSRWARRLAGGLALVLLLLGAVLALRLLRVASDLQDARTNITTAGDLLEDGQIREARDLLAGATDLLVRANGELYRGADIAVLGPLPGVSQNLSALRESVSLALRIADGGRRTLTAATPLEGADGDLEVPLAAGAIPLDAVSAAQVELEGLLGAMPGAVPSDSPLLVGPVRRARAEVYEEALSRRTQVAVLSRGLSLLSEMAGATGPRRYLIAVANTAEMRGSGGMILSYGVLESRDGDFELPAFGRIDELALAAPLDPADLPALAVDYQRRWDGFDPLLRWRNANLAGDFTVVAPVLEQMYRTASGKDVDGVIQIDPTGLAAILEGIGPVTVPELGEVTADTVVPVVLNEAYVRFPGIDERSDVLKEVAEAVFTKLVNGRYDSLRPLAEALVRTVEGRHLLMHTTAHTPEAGLRFFGATGELVAPTGTDVFHLTAQNLSGNKLDYYLDTRLEVTGTREAGEVGSVDARITLTNQLPAGAPLPTYIVGPGPTQDPQPPGVERTLVTLYLPAGASVEGVEGDPTLEPVSSGTEAGRPYAAFIVDVPAGGARTVELKLQLPPMAPGPYALRLVPSPRVRPTTAHIDVATEAGPVQGDVELDRTWSFDAAAPPSPVTAVASDR